MAKRNQPYLPLYVQDFLTDEKLAECSAATNGVYIRILCLMHKSETYGKILLKQKYKQSDKQSDKQDINICSCFAKQLSRHMPYKETEIENAINELLEENVCYIENDFLCQKRMIRDNYISEVRSTAGKSGGGNPNFGKTKLQTNLQTNTENEIENESESEDEKENKKSLEYLEKNLNEFMENFSDIDVRFEYNKFCDWLKSKGRRYKDYSAAFRNWLRNDSIPKKRIEIIKKELINIPKAFAGWEKTGKISKDNLGHKIMQYKRWNGEEYEYIFFCDKCDKQFT